jgi:hypothetical protein
MNADDTKLRRALAELVQSRLVELDKVERAKLAPAPQSADNDPTRAYRFTSVLTPALTLDELLMVDEELRKFIAMAPPSVTRAMPLECIDLVYDPATMAWSWCIVYIPAQNALLTPERR